MDEQRGKAAELQQALDMKQKALKAELQEAQLLLAQERTRVGHLEKSLVDANHSHGSTNLKVCPCCCASDVPTCRGDGPANVTTSSKHVSCLQDVLRMCLACIGSTPPTTPDFTAVSCVMKEEFPNHSLTQIYHPFVLHHSFFECVSFLRTVLSSSLYEAWVAFTRPLFAVSALCQLLDLSLPCLSLIAHC